MANLSEGTYFRIGDGPVRKVIGVRGFGFQIAFVDITGHLRGVEGEIPIPALGAVTIDPAVGEALEEAFAAIDEQDDALMRLRERHRTTTIQLCIAGLLGAFAGLCGLLHLL